MTDHRSIVATGFAVGGWLLGVPSAIGLLAMVAGLVFLRAPDDKSAYLDVGKYGIAGLINNGAKGVGDVLGFLGGIGGWLEGVLAVAFAVALGLAVLLVFAGRGIARHAAGWGVTGIVIASVFALFWAVVFLSTARSAAAVPAAGTAAAGYAIWVLGWK
jgi:hypothetical protein